MTAYDIFESNRKQIDGLCAERQAHLAQIAGLAAERQAHLDQIDGLAAECNALRVELGYKQAEFEKLATLLGGAQAEFETPPKSSFGIQQVASLRPTIDQLRKIGENWADLMYILEKFGEAYHLLLTRYAKFHTGDRVQLGITPLINETETPGWIGSKHFLVAGAYGTVRDVDVRNGRFYYQVVFDAESWIDSHGTEHAIAANNRHSYCLVENELVTAA